MTIPSLFRKFLLTALLLAPWTAISGEVEMTSYTHEKESFTLQYPSDWEAREDVTYEVFKIPFLAVRPLEGENDAFRENVNVVTEKISGKFSLQEYLNANIKNMPKSLPSFKNLGTGELKDAQAPCRYLVYSHESGGIPMKAVAFFFTKGKKGYSLTCTSTPENFKAYWELFTSIGRSFDP